MAGLSAREKRELFLGHDLFGGLPPDDLDLLLSHARVEPYAAGDQIFAKGSTGRSMMAILRGEIRISAASPTGRELVLSVLRAGEIFGEIALIDGQDRTADAMAVVDCEVLVLDHRDFIPILERRADLCIQLLKMLCRRLRLTDQQVQDAVFERLDSRIAKVLARLASELPRHPGAGREVSLRVSQQEIANMVGAARESVNKQLHVWRAAGLIRLDKRLVVIPDIAAILALA